MSLVVNIKKSFNGFNLNINFEVESEVLALLGASGCGKSMTLKCIAGIVTPDEGKIILDGVTLFDSEKKINLSPQKRKVGYLFQNSALFPNMTVKQNILCGLYFEKDNYIKHQKVNEMLKMFYLTGLENRLPSELSGGQQQRVALARILVTNPKIIMLDEPFSALDSYLRWQLEQELASILSEYNGTTLFVSHNRDEVYRLCQKIAVVSNGKIDIVSDKWELFKNPQTYSASLLTGCKNISPVIKIDDKTLYCEKWGITLKSNQIIDNSIKFVGIRANDFLPCTEIQENSFEFKVVRSMVDTNDYIFIITNKNALKSQPIRWETDKLFYDQFLKLEAKYIKLPADKILLLRE